MRARMPSHDTHAATSRLSALAVQASMVALQRGERVVFQDVKVARGRVHVESGRLYVSIGWGSELLGEGSTTKCGTVPRKPKIRGEGGGVVA